jgi:hypothetical protein
VPTYPSSPQLTVDALLKQPRLLARSLSDLVYQRFVADRIFARGTPEMVQGGSATYQRSESIFPDRDTEEVGIRAEFPRTGWTEAIFTAAVRTYGLEVPINFKSIRRNQMDQVARAQVKLANSLVKFVDTQAMTLLTTDANVLTAAASGDWTTAATDIIADLANARTQIENQNEGYEPDTLIVNPAQNLDLLLDADIRNALPRETGASAVQTGRPIPILGFDQIIVTPNLTAGTVLVVTSNIIGTIADEQPDPSEGYRSYDPGAGQAPVSVKIYDVNEHDDRIVRCARWPAMWLSEPKSAFKITGA